MPNHHDVPLYYELPRDQQPPRTMTGESEYFVLAMINSGLAMIETFGTIDPNVEQVAPSSDDLHLDEPEIYYDAISHILQAGEYAGCDPAELCRNALSLQLSFKNEAQRMANNLRGTC